MLTPVSKGLLGLTVVGVIVGALWYLNSNPSVAEKIAPGSTTNSSSTSGGSSTVSVERVDEDALVVAANTWAGQAPLAYMNNGEKEPSKNSRFYKEFGQLVQIEVMDDFMASRSALTSGEIDVLMFCTVGEFSIESAGLVGSGVKIVAHYDKSFGGDALVAREGINSIRDLVGKTIALAPGSPSHGLFLNLIKVSGLSQEQFSIREVKDGLDAAQVFKSEAVDAAFVWSPDDKDCVDKVSGSKVIFSTKDAPEIVWDAILITDKVSTRKREAVAKFLAGILYANGKINTSSSVRNEAVKNMCTVFNQSDEGFWSNLTVAKFMTLGDNLNFFGMNPLYRGVTGEELYSQMGDAYRQLKTVNGPLIAGDIPSFREVSDLSFIRDLKNHPKLANQVPDAAPRFSAPTAETYTAPALTTNTITVEFASGVSALNGEAKRIIKRNFGNIAKRFSTSRIRIEGNTDNVGSDELNRVLSLRRAETVKAFLIENYGWDSNRIVVVGNGPDKPVTDNDTKEGRQMNRRTDFQLINQ